MVQLLNGLFDPLTESQSVPWDYIGFVLDCALAATFVAVSAQATWSKEWAVRALRAGG